MEENNKFMENMHDEVEVQDEGNHHSATTEHSSKEDEPQEDKQKICEEQIVLGMEFNSVESGCKFYRSYGGKKGFNVRKNHQRKNKAGIITQFICCCSKEGHRKVCKNTENASYRQPLSRIGCNAHMKCHKQKNGKFRVVSFDDNHNHELIRTPMKHLLKVNRQMTIAQQAHADDADMSGIPIKGTVELMSREVGGREHLGFTDKDYQNYTHRKRKKAMEKGDAVAISQYFQQMQSKDTGFFHSMQIDEDNMIGNIFWVDSHAISDYNRFGDVICFDTTYQTNKCGRPFAPFIGVNHHKQTILFGAALLYDETIESFRWLFETFLTAMSGKKPKTILTDQSAAMAKAISDVFPETIHRLCVWHIHQNAAKHLSHVYHGTEFAQDFNECLYDYEDEVDWLLAWNNLLDKYSLKENKWLQDIFAVREKWALVYGRHTFTADMKSTQRSEGMNKVLKGYLKPSLELLRFLQHYERVLQDRRYEELKADFRMIETMPVLVVNVEMLRHAREIYTPEVFEIFQKEYMRWGDYNIDKIHKSEMTSEYKITYIDKSHEHLVKFEVSTSSVSCSCMKFSFVGILCAHALKVLDKKNVKRLPPQYIIKRWTRDAKARSMISYHGIGSDKESMGKYYSHLCRNFREIASFAAEHKDLFAYANSRSIELLKDLEQMKEQLRSHNSSGGNSFCQDEHVESVNPSQNSIQVKAIGVKRKRTVGRPRQFKGPLEKGKQHRSARMAKPPTRR